MPGPGAAAGAKAASTAAGRLSAGAASRSGAARAANGAAAADAAKRAPARPPGGTVSVSPPRGEEDERGNPLRFGSTATGLIGLAGAALMLLILVAVVPLLALEASASACGGGEQALPIQTNHRSDPEDLSETQIEIRIYLVGQVMKMTPRQIIAAYDVAFVESTMRNIDGGDATSTGVFQQQDFSPWTDGGRNRNNVVDASISFFLAVRRKDDGQSIPVLAQDVQASAYPERYYGTLSRGIDAYRRISSLIGSAAGVKSIDNLQGVTISGAGLDSLGAGAACGGLTATGPANLKQGVTLYRPRAYRALPPELWAGSGEPEQVDARIWADAVWLMSAYQLKATAARETGHHTHGDGTALDMVPASGNSQRDWDASALRLARDLGWTPGCGPNGLSRAAGGLCDLVPAIVFIGYNGYPGHGDPAHAGSNAHIHVSWYGSCYGCGGGGLVPPRAWVRAFPTGVEEPAAASGGIGGRGSAA